MKRENTNSKGDFVLKNRFKTFVLKISGILKYVLFEIYDFMYTDRKNFRLSSSMSTVIF